MSTVGRDMMDECEMLLVDYARGALNEAQHVLVASYLEMSEQGRARAVLWERLGGALMERCCEPVAMTENSLQAVMDRLDGCEQSEQCAPYSPRHKINIPMPQPLCMEISVRCGAGAVWRAVWPGVRVLRIPAGAENCAMHIIRMRPGARLPRHRHAGREITLVLDGFFADVSGTHKRGDILIMDAGTVHAPRAGDGAGCACLIVSEAPRTALPLHRLLARLMGRI